nr:MAG TPA: Putative Holin-like Toxin (Hol-Tox) [Caudoviricetes sp.]
MGVVLMDNNHFDFNDLMAFGMFILALLTFVFTFIR